MRVSPAIRVKGVSHVKCQGSANPNDRSLREIAKAGRQHACTFDTLIYPEPETSVSTSRTWSGLSSNDGRGSNPLPARSDGLDNVDGGPDDEGYSAHGNSRQVGNARFTRP
jgi:hypothetical protein